MSASPRKQTSAGASSNVRFGSLADICSALGDVCFVPKADVRSNSRTGLALWLAARHHSITSVAATSKVLGNVSPSAFAVFLLGLIQSLWVLRQEDQRVWHPSESCLRKQPHGDTSQAGQLHQTLAPPASKVSLDQTDNGNRRAIAKFAMNSLC